MSQTKSSKLHLRWSYRSCMYCFCRHRGIIQPKVQFTLHQCGYIIRKLSYNIKFHEIVLARKLCRKIRMLSSESEMSRPFPQICRCAERVATDVPPHQGSNVNRLAKSLVHPDANDGTSDAPNLYCSIRLVPSACRLRRAA